MASLSFTPAERQEILAATRRLGKLKPKTQAKILTARSQQAAPLAAAASPARRPIPPAVPSTFFDDAMPDAGAPVDVFSSEGREAARDAFARAEAAKQLDLLAHNCLLEIDRYMRLRSLRLLDLFRRRDINKSGDTVGEVGAAENSDNELDAAEFAGILAKTELRLTAEEIGAVIAFLDKSGDGVLDVTEVETAMRRAKMRQRNIPRDAMTRLNKTASSPARDGQQLAAFLPKVLQRRHFTVQPDATTDNAQWRTIHGAKEHTRC